MTVLKENGELLLAYRPAKDEILKIPEAEKPAKTPIEIQTNEELLLQGLHLEQYKHATFEPELYYLEGFKRDPSNIRINGAYGKLFLRGGLLSESEGYFRKAIEKNF